VPCALAGELFGRELVPGGLLVHLRSTGRRSDDRDAAGSG
jgi:hypothetical protein